MKNILERFEISVEEFTEIVDANPSLRGFILGYIGEAKAKKLIKENPSVSDISSAVFMDFSIMLKISFSRTDCFFFFLSSFFSLIV